MKTRTGMKYGKIALSLAVLALACGANATKVTVNDADFATFSVDVDGNGAADFTSLSLYPGQVRLNVNVDYLLAGVTLPGKVAVGDGRSAINVSTADVAGLPIWSGAFETTTGDRWNNISTMTQALISDPIRLGWMTGNKGIGTEDVSLIGYVLDSRNFNYTTGTGSVDVYYNYYGDFAVANSGSHSVSLADTGFQSIPEPATFGLMSIAGILFYAIRRVRRFNMPYK